MDKNDRRIIRSDAARRCVQLLQLQRVSVVHAGPATSANAQFGDASGSGQQAGDEYMDDEETELAVYRTR